MMEPIRPSVWRRAKRKTAAIEGDEAGGAQEDAIEARPQLAASPRCRLQAIRLQVGVEPPDQAADELLSGALPIGERLPLVPQPLGMDPTERVLADVELAGVVADDHRLVAEPVRGDGAPQRTLGGDAGRVRGHLQGSDAELLKVVLPGGLVGKLPLGVRFQLPDHRPGQVVFPHVLQRRVINDVVGMAGNSRKFSLLLLPVVPNQAKLSLPICVQTAVAPRWRAPVSSTVIQRAVCSPACSTSWFSVRQSSCLSISSRITSRLEMPIPNACS